MNPLLKAALRYATFGWCVFPVKPGQKTPITIHGVKDATRSEKTIRDWWAKWPDANVAVACGRVSGIYVVDVDVTEDRAVDGYDSLKKLPELMPTTVFQHTPRGGCHLFYQTDDPPANKNSFLPGVDIRGDGYYVLLAPSIHPNGKQYAWAEGHEPWAMQIEKYPDFLRPAKKEVWSNYTSPTTDKTATEIHDAMRATTGTMTFNAPPQHPNSVQHRASLYLATCDPAIQGQAGHDKLLWACGAMTWGCEMPADRAYDILASEFNPRCVPPWDLSDQKDEKDFRRKIAQSLKNPPDKPRGWILNDPTYAQVAETELRPDIQAFIKQTKEAYKNNVIIPLLQGDAAKELKFLTQPTGLLGELCSWINATAFKPQPYLTLGCALAFLGVLFGRKVKDTLGSRTNLYVMSVAPSSAGKNHAMNKIRELCLAADCVHLLGGSDIASDSAIESRMSRQAATIFMLDEIGHLLVNIKSGTSPHQAQVVSMLMQLYSAAPNVYLGREYADAGNQRTIVQPCCCVYGVATPDKFASGLSSSELNDGWLSRCLVFYVEDEPRKSRDTDLTAPPPQHLVELVKAWGKRIVDTPTDGETISQFVVGSADNLQEAPPEQIVVPTNPDAEKRCRDFDDMAEFLSKKDPRLSASWLKAEENARRIALIIGCSDSYENPVVTISAADRACRMVKKIIEDFGTYVVPAIADGRTEAQKHKIIGIIKKFGKKGGLKREITFKTRWVNGKQRNDLLADLIEGGDLVCRLTASGKTSRYWVTEFSPSDPTPNE